MVKVSCEDILALMTFKVLDKIMGTPKFANMIELQKQLSSNIIAVGCPWVKGKVQLVPLQYPTNFDLRNGGPYYPPTQQSPTYPNIHTGTSTADCERLRAETTKDQRNWQTYKHCKRICIKHMSEAI